MKTGFRLKTSLPAAPAAVYRTWLSGAGHTAMTGAAATASDREGGSFTAWDGYISGKNLTLKPEWCIVQAWRTSQFAPTDPDSRLELCIHPADDGCELLLIHTDIPAEQTEGYEGGWVTHYFEPMREYFASLGMAKAATRTTVKKTAKKASSKKKSAKRKAAKKKTAKRKAAKKKAAKKRPAKKKSAARRVRRR